MNRWARQAGRIWVAVIAAYALLVQVIAPLQAADMRLAGSDPLLVLCDGAALADGSSDGEGHDHGPLCCILCAPAALAGYPGPATLSTPVLFSAAPVVFALARTGEPRAPPEREPIIPRGPPSLA